MSQRMTFYRFPWVSRTLVLFRPFSDVGGGSIVQSSEDTNGLQSAVQAAVSFQNGHFGTRRRLALRFGAHSCLQSSERLNPRQRPRMVEKARASEKPKGIGKKSSVDSRWLRILQGGIPMRNTFILSVSAETLRMNVFRIGIPP